MIYALHPTPAVCGYPKKRTLDLIANTEKFDRGLYAGAIGIISEAHITLCVGIRSALHHKEEYWFWGGAGLVPSSKPEAEYKEMSNKMKAFERLLDKNKLLHVKESVLPHPTLQSVENIRNVEFTKRDSQQEDQNRKKVN